MDGRVSIVEVGPRDGLQNERLSVPVDLRIELITRLVQAGLRRIEIGSLVSLRRVPQMADSADLARTLPQIEGVQFCMLVPNEQGAREAAMLPIHEIAVFASASESFSQRNINCSIDESLARFEPVMARASARSIPVRGYVSCALGCPYEGEIALANVVALSRRLARLGCHEISLADTIGIGTPRQARMMVEAVASEVPAAMLAVHFHDSRGQALANILACLEAGIRTIDSSVAGLGGCPFAPGASGNVATEDVIYMLDGLGLETGVDLRAVAAAGQMIARRLGRVSGSKVAQALFAGTAACQPV